MKKVLVMVGLPGSGKTSFAKNYKKINNKIGWYSAKSYRVNHIDLDETFKSYRYNKYEKPVAIKKMINDYVDSGIDEVIIDGLFLKNNDILMVLNKVENRCNIDKIEIHYWKPNVENCLWNDKYRRSEHSEITIKNATVEIPDAALISSEFKNIEVKIITHDVMKKPMWKLLVDKYKVCLDDENKMTSDTWCLGGDFQTCWGTGGSVSADPQSTTYRQFDELLEKVCPSITFMQYKKIYGDCIDIETKSESDYYGGSTEHAYFVCDVEKLFTGLIDMGLVNEEIE